MRSEPACFFAALRCFEPKFSIPDTFQVQIITEIYDETRVDWRIKAEFRVFPVDFVQFLDFCPEVGHFAVTIKKLRDFGRVRNFCFSRFKSFFKKSCHATHASSRTAPHPWSILESRLFTYVVVQWYQFTFQNISNLSHIYHI